MKKFLFLSIFMSCILSSTCSILFVCAKDAYGLPAFPGAQGFGSSTPGGRGGRVIEVTTLNASGPGSFREACEASGTRIVVFRTGGTIILTSDIEIKEPYITIAGQTAPGDGICIRGAALRILTHDVIVRGLRFRVGDDPSGPDPDNRDGLGIANSATPPYNIIVDHCSISWAMDENAATWYECHDITFQWCIFSEALVVPDDESYGFLIGDYSTNISVHHSLFAHNKDRSPTIKNNANAEFINNVIYNWRWYATRMYGGGNIIANFYKTGSNWTGGKEVAIEEIPSIRAYVHNNIGPSRTSDSQDDWIMVNGSDAHRSSAPVVSPSGITTYAAKDVLDLVLDHAGAVYPKKDSVDDRIINSVRNGTGSIIGSQNEVGGWPTYNSGTPPQDTDHDGMPDSWEISKGLNPNDSSDANQDRDGDGYTNIEEYINSLIPLRGASTILPPQNLRVTN